MKKTIRGVIADNVKQYMTDHTPATLAAHSGIPKTKINRILAGTVDCDIDTISALASSLGVKSGALLDDALDEGAAAFRSKLLSLPPEARAKISQFLDTMTGAHVEQRASNVVNTHIAVAV
ncbi:helix-turn-helix transcriptional regulator [Paraburkholderia sp. SARCC-3016]|uniref:helix-turn-helix domain-containing protein n=1 Tax=Paraburkholderia sp. SARCC-3016 TaxID=3058611 RepID=UPI002808E1D9|nr:helix-turn-helix transcriptional regulator [Paraburkholderia sp. SARCC-3016]MDQ7977167.1 helix-turn-helix transcriptional regulator [Paraburkholderia sp. SARCC-3016]